MRVIVVLILCWVLDTFATPDAWLLVTAFLIGIVPETFFTLVSELRRSLSRAISESLREPHPLTNLEGIDLYDRSRLEDEGVNNVEALAHHDLVELMLATRVPVARLVDWVDQAILYLHTVDERGKTISRDALRGAGIRTASDFRAVGSSEDLPTVLAAFCDGKWGTRAQLDLVLRVIDDEEWMANVLEWHKNPAPGPPRVRGPRRHLAPGRRGLTAASIWRSSEKAWVSCCLQHTAQASAGRDDRI